jgi:predicted ATPase/class 3 adenylate cyclase
MPEWPRGTVTFLFTDIEGSTERWERERQAMAAAVGRHIAVLEVAIQEHGGVHFKTVGDAVQAAFPTAPQALAAAVQGQRALLAEDWDSIGGIRVRMALHAGEAEPDARGDYLTAPLNRLSRLLATGHGGQILLTQTVQQLSRGALPSSAELKDLGEHRLRDLLEPERVYQLLHPGFPVEFPPLKSLELRPNNLPLQPTLFLGREREMTQVVDLLRRPEVRLLTLTGPGGTGKTRLALQASAELLDDFSDGVFFVSLASLTDPALVPSAIATALGVREEGERSLGSRLQDFLSKKQLLLVLDNMEHLTGATPIIGTLLAESADLTVVVTSRTPLHLRAEHEYPVPPLALPRRKPPPSLEQLSQYEAVRLFIERAKSVKPEFIVNNENAPAVAEICWRLDGLPLAIELAAARVRMLPPQALLGRLEHRLPLLTGGARDAPQRQRTLRDTIAWSYDLLAPDEQTLFRQLAVFTGGTTLDAIEAVSGEPKSLDIFSRLEQLVEDNLVQQEEGPGGHPRFRMLETIREFGLEQLEQAGEIDAARTCHAMFFLALIESAEAALTGPEQNLWFDRLDADHDNLRFALEWMLAQEPRAALRVAAPVGWFWEIRGHLAEGRQWLKRVLAAVDESLPGRAGVLTRAAALAIWQGDFAAADALLQQSLEFGRRDGEDQAVAQALMVQAGMAGIRGDYVRATAGAEEALAVSRRLGAEAMVASNLGNLGWLALMRGDLDQAGPLMEEALSLDRARGDQQSIAIAQANLGDLATERAEYGRAGTHLYESLNLIYEQQNLARLTETLSSIATLAARSDRLEAATRLFGAVSTLRQEIEVPLPPYERDKHDHEVAILRSHLAANTFRVAWDAGRGMSLEDAVAEARALTLARVSGDQN